MKNLSLEVDELRPEYTRSDFGEMVRGKYGATQVEFSELVHLLLACIGESEGVRFSLHHVGNFATNRRFGEWTYEFGVGNQITLRYWLDSLRSIETTIANPACVTDEQEKTELNQRLIDGVVTLRMEVREHDLRST